MKILISENQLEKLITENSLNFCASERFDNLYGTKLSHRYDFSPYREEDLQKKWYICSYLKECEDFNKFFHIIKTAFPYVDYSKLDEETKYDHCCIGGCCGSLRGFLAASRRPRV